MKKSTFLFVLFFNFFLVQSQVGIGTTNPDASAILELDSDNQGLLTPRMTTVERNGISSPANGLIVFDTDDNSFYYYTASNWVELEGAEVRDNYKLVKSVADLANELVAGGGSRYLLASNYVYEINGTIEFDFPINLNGANIEGRDTGQDIIKNSSGTALFSGTNGGRLKNLRIEAEDQQLFNISGSGGGSMIAYTVIVNNASSLGSIDGLFAVLFEILQVLNTDNGLAASNMSSFFLDKIFWTNANTGTFLTLSGSFNNLQIANGRIVTDAGEIGIDVSANPVVNLSALLTQISFDGIGQNVRPYTVGAYPNFNFVNRWYVEAQGIPRETDGTASGNFFYNGDLTTGFVQTITDGTAVEVQGSGTFVANSLFRFNAAGGNNRLVYAGDKQREFTANVSMSVRVTNANGNFYAFIIAKNGNLVTESNSVIYIDNGTQIQNISINANVNLNNGDYIEVYVQRLTGAGSDTLAVFSENLSIR